MLLLGSPVAKEIDEKIKGSGLNPSLSIYQVGSKEDSVLYANSLEKKMNKLGIKVSRINLPEDTTVDQINEEIDADPSDGIIIMRPLPFDETKVLIPPSKDVDGMTAESLGKLFMGDDDCFAPATAEAVMKIFEHYEIPLEGKDVLVIGRSNVIGKPVAMMCLQKNATVTICHSRSKDIEGKIKGADIIITAVGKKDFITSGVDGKIVIDVSINCTEDGVFGDCSRNLYEKAEMITPVPRGVGSVTTSVIAEHVLRACVQNLS